MERHFLDVSGKLSMRALCTSTSVENALEQS